MNSRQATCSTHTCRLPVICDSCPRSTPSPSSRGLDTTHLFLRLSTVNSHPPDLGIFEARDSVVLIQTGWPAPQLPLRPECAGEEDSKAPESSGRDLSVCHHLSPDSQKKLDLLKV